MSEPSARKRKAFNRKHREWQVRATERARAVLRPGMRVTRVMCGGVKGTFGFTGWEGEWACGKTVSDCHAVSIRKIDGKPVDFTEGEPRPPFMTWRGDVLEATA